MWVSRAAGTRETSDEFQALFEGPGQALQRGLCGIASPALDPADVGLADPGPLRQLALRQAASHPGVAELQAKLDSGFEPPPQLGFARCLSRFTLSRPVLEPGSHVNSQVSHRYALEYHSLCVLAHRAVEGPAPQCLSPDRR